MLACLTPSSSKTSEANLILTSPPTRQYLSLTSHAVRPGGRAQGCTLGTLRAALKVRLAAAGILPEDEVPYTVARRLFSLEHFVDFEASDPATRSHLLSAAFELLDVAWQRSIPVCFPPLRYTDGSPLMF